MKTVLLGFLLSVIAYQQSKSQELFGRYSNMIEYLDFKSNGTVDFKLDQFYEYCGSGNYQIKDGFLKITLTKLLVPYSVMKSLEKLTSPDSVTIYVFDALTNKRFDGPINILLIKDENVIVHNEIQSDFIRFSIKECLSGVDIQIKFIGYPIFTQRLTSHAKTDFRINFSPYPSPEQTQTFLMDEGDGIAIKINGGALLIREKNNSVVVWRQLRS